MYIAVDLTIVTLVEIIKKVHVRSMQGPCKKYTTIIEVISNTLYTDAELIYLTTFGKLKII